ncbi:MAG: hypothetical protein JNL06_14910 [Alphaproteobacteria bacterium]|nr:hypothetical protein [Alphaproteobacteria bacterium]
MKDPAANPPKDALRDARVRPDSWLIGAFLVLFGVAVSASLPQITGAVRTAVADAAKSGATDKAQRPTIRQHLAGLRVVLPKLFGGHDFVPTAAPSVAFVAVNNRVFARPTDLAARAQERGFSARAPPFQG